MTAGRPSQRPRQKKQKGCPSKPPWTSSPGMKGNLSLQTIFPALNADRTNYCKTALPDREAEI